MKRACAKYREQVHEYIAGKHTYYSYRLVARRQKWSARTSLDCRYTYSAQKRAKKYVDSGKFITFRFRVTFSRKRDFSIYLRGGKSTRR